VLRALARQVMHHLAARATIAELERAVAERLLAEDSLRTSQHRYEQLTRVVPVGIFRTDPRGQCEYVNQRWSEFTGLDLERARGTGWMAAIDPHDRTHVAALWQTAVNARGPFTAEYRFRREDGRAIWVLGQAAPELDPSGRLLGYVGTITDISERKRAEHALHDNEERSRAIIAALEEGIVVLDQDGIVRVANASAERILGSDRQDLLGCAMPDPRWQQVREDGSPFLPDEHPALIALRTGQPQPGVVIGMTRPDGGRIWLSSNAHPLLSPAGGINGVVASFFDITERKSLEEQLRQNQKMEAIGRLAGGVAHDFNNLLTVIKGHAGLLLDQTGADPVRKDAEPILRAAKRAETLTRQLLDFSRQSIIKHETLNFGQLVSDEGLLLRRLIGEDIQLVIAPAHEPCFIKADAGQMHQVLMNLAVNARDAMPDGGKLVITTTNVDLDAAAVRKLGGLKPGPFVSLAVRDTGMGIDARTLPRIFEPFFTTKEKGKGTGLGLATIFGIVKQSGGAISVDSKPGKGSTFNVLLPRVAPGEVMVEARTDRISRRPSHELLLLAEDDDDVRELARHVLSTAGYQVLAAANGAEALAHYRNLGDQVHLLITDVVMPGMGGRQLAEQLHAMQPTLKVLYTSGYTDDAVMHHQVQGQGAEFLQKPYSANLLKVTVRRVLDSR
nr:PAS domain S-box protein [Planctomycetota bacterium]